MPDTISREVEFQSTHLLRGATRFAVAAESPNVVSIHAPLARCDAESYCRKCSRRCFNPRTSCEVRQSLRIILVTKAKFQSTHLLRGATLILYLSPSNQMFQSTHLLRGATLFGHACRISLRVSIHAPLARCDGGTTLRRGCLPRFNPRTSCEVRQQKDVFIVSFARIDGDISPLIQFVLTKLRI